MAKKIKNACIFRRSVVSSFCWPKYLNLNQILKQGFYAVALLKYSQIRQDLLRFVPRTTKNPLFTKFFDLKGAVFCVDFGEAKHIRLTPMGDNEPKDA